MRGLPTQRKRFYFEPCLELITIFKTDICCRDHSLITLRCQKNQINFSVHKAVQRLFYWAFANLKRCPNVICAAFGASRSYNLRERLRFGTDLDRLFFNASLRSYQVFAQVALEIRVDCVELSPKFAISGAVCVQQRAQFDSRNAITDLFCVAAAVFCGRPASPGPADKKILKNSSFPRRVATLM